MYKEGFESYTRGLESSKVFTLEELVKYNIDHTDPELPERPYLRTFSLRSNADVL